MALTKISTAMWNSVPHHLSHDFNVDDVLFVDVSENKVGIGTTSPGSTFQVKTGTNNNIAFNVISSGTLNGIQRITSYNDAITSSVPLAINGLDLYFITGSTNTERMRIDSSGSVIVKNSTTAGANIQLQSDNGTWTQNDVISNLNTYISDTSGVGARDVAAIKVINDQVGVNTTTSGAMAFYTSPYNGSVTERMRIDSSGRVRIGGSGTPNGNLDVRTAGQSGVPSLGTAGNGINLTRTDGQTGGSIGYTTQGHIYIQSQRFDSANANDLFLQPVGGKVGIGTDSPIGKLDIFGDSTNNVGLARFTNNYASGGVYFPTASFINTRGNHSYGIVADFRVNTASDGDRPSVLFFGQATSTSWQMGQQTSTNWGGAADGFGIGYRASNDPNSFTSWPTAYFTVDTSGNTLSYSSSRAPIFYDSDNTAWYADPAGTTHLNNVVISSTAASTAGYSVDIYDDVHLHNFEINYVSQLHFNDNVRFYDNGDDSYLIFKYGDTNNGGIVFKNGSDVLKGYIYADSGSFGLLNNTGNWAVRIPNGGSGLELRSANNVEFTVNNDHTLSYGSSRAPIFYDSNDTNYYVDPNSSNLSIKVVGEISNSNYAAGNLQAGALNIGNTDTNYRWDGSTWPSDIRAGILAHALDYWEFAIHNSGSSVESVFYYADPYIYMGRDIGWGTTSIVAANSFRAPVFYDSNDTGYYLDPNSTSNVVNIAMNGELRLHSYGSTTFLRGSGDAANYTTQNVVLSGWNGLGLYNPTTGGVLPNQTTGFYDFRNGIFDVKGSFRAPIFYDSNNTAGYADLASDNKSLAINGGIKFANTNAQSKSGFIGRHGSGGSLSTDLYPGAIYSIGDNYRPSGTGLSNHYGVGYSHTNASFYGLTGQSGWGFYVSDAGTARVQLGASNGTISCTGDVVAYASDGRLKENIKPIKNALEKVSKINGVYYDWVENIKEEYDFHPSKMHEVGVIAQEIQDVMPEVVDIAPFDMIYSQKTGRRKIQKKMETELNRKVSDKEAKEEFEKLPIKEQIALQDKNDFLTVKYERLVPLLIEAVKELSEKVKMLENK